MKFQYYIIFSVFFELFFLLTFFFRPTLNFELEPTQVNSTEGHSFVAELSSPIFGYRPLSDTELSPRRSDLVILEDGSPLGPAHALHDRVREVGNGSFSHWGNHVYMSSSDNTDIRENGRKYVFRYSLIPTPYLTAMSTVGVIANSIILAIYLCKYLLKRQGIIVFLKFLSLAALFCLAPYSWIDYIFSDAARMHTSGRTDFLVLYVFVISITFSGLIVAPFIQSWKLRIPIIIVFLFGFGIDRSFFAIAGQHISFEMSETLVRERSMALTVLPLYLGSILAHGVVTVMLLAIPFLLPSPKSVSLGKGWATLPFAGFLVTGLVVHWTAGRTEAFPAPYGTPVKLLLARFSPPHVANEKRADVEYERPLKPSLNKIVMVVDESVRGDVMGLNNPVYDNTPTLKDNGQVYNYGVATSASNCSVAARLIMRIGLRPNQLPDTVGVWRRMPSVWQFAKKAGYRTILIDGHRLPGEFHSYMDQEEARFIDEQIGFTEQPDTRKEYQIAEYLLELMRNKEPMFIYVNKQGVHTDYKYRYPPDMNYNPSLQTSSLDNDKQNIIIDYHRALLWGVDGFFKKALPGFLRNDALMIYTSDHGQSLFEGGYDLSHCSLSEDLHRGEVMIPLFVVSQSDEFASLFKAEAARAFGRATQFEIFPTLLEVMGYNGEWVEREYGPSLLRVPIKRKREFLMGTFYHPAALWLDAELRN